MGSIRKRISRLEEQDPGWGYREKLLLDKALARLAHEDLHLLTAYLRRGDGEYAEPTKEEEVVLLRLEERLEEVQDGL